MKLQYCILLLICFACLQCGNPAGQSATEKAQAEAAAAKAKLDSLERVLAQQTTTSEGTQTSDNNTTATTSTEEGGFPTSQTIEQGKLNPIDEGQTDASFKAFRTQLIKAVNKKDVDHLMSVVTNEIKISFGVAQGKENFRKMWQLDSIPKKTMLWQELRNVLQLGGTFEGENRNVFSAPYVFSTFSQGYDAHEYGAIVGEGVRVRNAPKRNGKIVRSASYDIVRLIYEKDLPIERIGGEKHPWVKVQFSDDTEGYVYGKYVRGQVDYRAFFEKIDDKWMMNAFLKGD